MKLDPKLAQDIVNKMMTRIPYNVNMMDDQGYIIASGDPQRLNTLHVGAVAAINQQTTLPMHDSYGDHGQPGVNMPIVFNNQIIGVIGITGDPEKVTPLASLLRVATELLLDQNQHNLQEKQYETTLNRFLYHWSQVTQQIDTNTNLLLEAQQLEIDILKPRTAIVLPKQTLPIGLLDATDFQFDLDTTTLIVLTALPATIARFTAYCQTGQHRLGIGLFDRNVGNSVRQARQTLRISQIFQRPDFIHYSQIAFIQALLDGHLHVTDLQQRFQKLASTANGRELIKTLGMFVRLNTNVLQTAAALHIHRNTLSYRLDRLQQIFQLDPHQTLDLFTLYVGYLYFKADK